jgi:hypothetical protein
MTEPASTAALPSNPFQALASDIQAMLIQAQGGAATPAASTSVTGTTTAVSAEQQMATDLQTMMTDLQGATAQTTAASTADSTSRTASTNPADPTGQSQPHHHRHHHEDGGGEASGSSAVASSSTPSGSTSAETTTDDEAVSQMFAADVTQALAAYGGNAGSSMMPALMV